jgi:hypothetical protein
MDILWNVALCSLVILLDVSYVLTAFIIITLILEAASTSETSFKFCRITRRKSPQYSHLYTLNIRRRENLKYHQVKIRLSAKNQFVDRPVPVMASSLWTALCLLWPAVCGPPCACYDQQFVDRPVPVMAGSRRPPSLKSLSC